MLQRLLAFVAALTLGDYLLWNWSLGGNHDVLALVSGLTLPPLAIAGLFVLALNLARLLAHSSAWARSSLLTRSAERAGISRASRRARARGTRARLAPPTVAARLEGAQDLAAAATASSPTASSPARTPSAGSSSSRKLAA